MKKSYVLSFLIFLINILPLARAAQVAVVKSSKAIVYAEASLATPIGYVTSGKKLLVGEVAQERGTVLPVVVAGKIAYVRLVDINVVEDEGILIGNEKKVREHTVADSLEFNHIDRLNGDSFVVASLNAFSMGEEWDQINEEVGNESGQSATGLNVMFEYRPLDERYSFSIGVGYYTAEANDAKFRLATIEGNYYYSPIKFGLVSMELFGGLLFSGDARLQLSADSTESRGTMYGYQLGVQGRLLPKYKFGAAFGLALRNLSFGGLDEVERQTGATTFDEVTFKSINSINLFAGVSYRF